MYAHVTTRGWSSETAVNDAIERASLSDREAKTLVRDWTHRLPASSARVTPGMRSHVPNLVAFVEGKPFDTALAMAEIMDHVTDSEQADVLYDWLVGLEATLSGA